MTGNQSYLVKPTEFGSSLLILKRDLQNRLLTSGKKSDRIPLTAMMRSSTRENRPQESLWDGGKRRARPGEYTAELAPERPLLAQ